MTDPPTATPAELAAAPVLVLSMCVRPQQVTRLVLGDPGARLRQYLDALGRLLTCAPAVNAILLIENSGADLAPFRTLVDERNVHGKDVELIGVRIDDLPGDRGKGYGEFSAIDRGLEQSRLACERRYMVKLTGRLGVANLASLVRALPPQYDMVADVHPDPRNPSVGMVDTRLMAFATAFYRRQAAGLYQEMNDATGAWAEHAFYLLARRAAGMRVFPRLPREPRWIGASASTGERYDNLTARAKYPLKVVRRALDRALGRPDLRSIQAPPAGRVGA